MPLPLIDSHIHFCAHDQLDELERYRREIGAEKICVLSLPARPRINFNPEVLFAKARLGSRCFGLASFDYTSRWGSRPPGGDRTGQDDSIGNRIGLDLSGQVQRFHDLGFDGLKVFLGKPTLQRELGLKLTDPEVLGALKRAEKLGMPVLIHVADPPVFWSSQSISGFVPPGWGGAAKNGEGSEGMPSYEELQRQAIEVLRACPDLTVIFPHLLCMGQDLPRLSGVLDRYPGVCLDLAPGLYFYYELDRQRALAGEFFARYRKRILFGTDASWFPEWFTEFPHAPIDENLNRARQLLRFLAGEEQMDNPFVPTHRIQGMVRGLGLEPKILEDLCHDSFLRAYPQTPRALDRRACREYLDEFVDRLAAVGAGAEIMNGAVELVREMNELLQGGAR